MTVENAPVTQPDAGDNSYRPSESHELNFGINLTSQLFNRDWSAACQSFSPATTSGLPDLKICGDRDNTGRDQFRIAQVGDNIPFPSGITKKNLDASPQFSNEVNQAFNNTFGNLNPETQEKLRGLSVVSTKQVNKVIPGMPLDIPAVTPDLSERKGNVMAFSEVGIKKTKAPVQDVMNHELWHPIDNATGASKDPELRKAIDLGISRLPKSDQRNIAVRGKEQTDQRYAEFAGDIMALELGSNQKDLAYLRDRNNPYDNFREAREIIRKRFLK